MRMRMRDASRARQLALPSGTITTLDMLGASMPRGSGRSAQDADRYAANLRDELDGAALYAALATAEHDPLRGDLFKQLAHGESSHAQLWRDKLLAAGITLLSGRPAILARAVASAAGLAALGALTALFNGRTVAYSATRQLLLGGLAAAVTYGIGALLGASLA
jgi:hypothetical protein